MQPIHDSIEKVNDIISLHYTVRGITILCYVRKTDLMPVIICKNDKHLVTHYNVIFSNMTGILSHFSYIFY